MKWSPQQDAALQTVRRWLDDGERQTCYVAGWAGTGKTELARHLAEGVDGRVLFASFTGKAASVLRDRGCENAQTIHRLIYNPKGRSQERIRELLAEQRQLEEAKGQVHLEDSLRLERVRSEIEEERERLESPAFALNPDSQVRGAALVIIDECSMLSEQLATDLLSFGTPVLVLGDPAQLPPVRGEGYFTAQEPDVFLTEIHRQARDNPIIQLATTVREGGRLEPGSYGESRVHERGSDLSEVALEADQIIVGRNRTRRKVNDRVRELQGFTTHYPTEGDRLTCLRNDHEAGLLNGTAWETVACHERDEHLLRITARPEEGGSAFTFDAWKAPFDGERAAGWAGRKIQSFDFGWAITAHRAQGSQWDHVMVLDESDAFGRDARRWLYTACTRASKRLHVMEY